MRPGTCKHFNGSYHNKTCLAGVCYRDVTPDPDKPGSALREPCRTRMLFSNPNEAQRKSFDGRGKCEKYAEPSKEEIAAYEAETEAAIARMMKATAVISEVKREHRGKSWSGVKECPVCGGRLHMSHSGYNGHVHGKCETKDCIAWIE
jgi:hypothetical protein